MLGLGPTPESARLSETTTRGIRILARAEFEPERSSPADRYYFFSYRIRIENVGEETAQLLTRRWVVTDDHGEVTLVEGPGVVGETPVLAPGDAFEYTSFCPLQTHVGTMQGAYGMQVLPTGERFEAAIEPFILVVPGAVN